jgi:hypothetical protein
MKKLSKKLALNTETVRALAQGNLAGVGGAMMNQTRSGCAGGGCTGGGGGGTGGSATWGFDCSTQTLSAFASGCNC